MTLHLSEEDVGALFSPADAVAAIEACFERMAHGTVENRPRYRLGLEEGTLAVLAAADLELGFAGSTAYAAFRSGVRYAVLLFRADRPELAAVIDADTLAGCAPVRRAVWRRSISRARERRRSASSAAD